MPRVSAPHARQTLNLGHAESSFVMSETAQTRQKHSHQPIHWKTLAVSFVFLIVFALAGALFFLITKAAHVGQTLSFENEQSISLFAELKGAAGTLFSDRAPLKETDGRINILLLGRAGEHYPGKNLTDTIMLASIDTHTRRVALLSFPRDLYAPIGQGDTYTKINAIYQIGLDMQAGVDLIHETIETIAGVPIHYSVIVDFDGFEKAVDALGGVSVDVPRDLYDARYPGKNYSYETFEIHKGWQRLDGATALKYVRERHADPEGDFGRAKRQQQVMQAIRDKVFSTGTLLNILTLSRLLDALGESVKTDLTLEEMESFLALIRTLDTKNITTVVIDAWKPESLLRVSHIPTPNGNAFILVPRTGNWKEITQTADHLFELDSLKQEREQIESESPSIRIIATPSQSVLVLSLQRFLKDELGFSRTTVETSRLENAPERSTMRDTTDGTKLYSQNALLSRFDIGLETGTLPESSSQSSDFILTLGIDLEESAFLGETGTAPEEIDTQVLPPQEPKKKRKKH
ncbi:MAG: LCP family protein [Candidatus Moranbacteria bacterium]|nr:LCP family protein [Candidatus Moranbacteria bacterium]MBP7695948.1 LCP family protein [Candidatus Moranbacteria bacterium]